MVINFKEISWDKLNNISYLDFGYKLGISDITYVGTDMKCVYPHISKLYDCGLHVFVKIGPTCKWHCNKKSNSHSGYKNKQQADF